MHGLADSLIFMSVEKPGRMMEPHHNSALQMCSWVLSDATEVDVIVNYILLGFFTKISSFLGVM